MLSDICLSLSVLWQYDDSLSVVRVVFSARSPKLAEFWCMVSLSGPTYAKINTYSKINVRRAREREQTMQTFENAFSLILGDIIQI